MSDRPPHPGVDPDFWTTDAWRVGSDLGFRPIEAGDLDALRTWRNAQQHVLRQQEPLDEAHQAAWYAEAVVPSYAARHPRQMLVVMTDATGAAIAYGGLTNIDWISHRAELSFLDDDRRALDPEVYASDLQRFLAWVIEFTFGAVGLHRLFAETWADRTAHLALLEDAGFVCEGRMRDHVVKDGVVLDALIHGLLDEEGRR